jgi:hypothetical protein
MAGLTVCVPICSIFNMVVSALEAVRNCVNATREAISTRGDLPKKIRELQDLVAAAKANYEGKGIPTKDAESDLDDLKQKVKGVEQYIESLKRKQRDKGAMPGFPSLVMELTCTDLENKMAPDRKQRDKGAVPGFLHKQ